jgi:serine/threonine protein kinase
MSMDTSTKRGSADISALEASIGGAICLRRIGAGPAPTVGDRFEIEALIGTGGFGTVIRARDLHLERRVAIKLVPTENPAQGHASITAEARALASLDVNEVVTVFDWLATRVHTGRASFPCVAIVMALVDGQNLRGWMARVHTKEERLAILLSASKGLEAAHAVGLVHRDFKPENVIVTPDGQARVVDFGLAYRVNQAATTSQLARHGSAGIGTPEYMAPEALAGAVTPASDQYSFAVTAWEVLTGTRPFDRPGKTWTGDTLAHADRVEGPIAKILARGLAKTADRFPQLADLRSELERCLEPRPWRAAAALTVGAAVLSVAGGAWVLNNKRRK